MSDIERRKSQYRMAVFICISIFLTSIIMWQWVVTMRELDALDEESGRFHVILPRKIPALEQ